jgi:peptidoglycan/LPS O-acetylase OafA/YrhL
MKTFDLFRHNGYAALALAAVLVLVGASLWWHLIEKPWLRKSSHYVVATKNGTAA